MKKKITIISIHSCPNEKIGLGNSGGLNVYVKNLHSYLLSNNYESNLITRSHGNCDFDKHSDKVLHIDTKKSFTDKDVIFNRIKSDTDILISNYWTSAVFSNDYFKSISKKYHIPHTLEYLKKKHFPKYIMDSARYKLEKKSMITFDKIICFSSLEKKVLIENYNIVPSKILSSSPGFDSDLFFKIPKAESREKINLHIKDKLILFVGRLDFLKGLDIAINTIEIIKNSYPNVKLGIVGGDYGSDAQKIIEKDLNKKNLTDNIIWFGSIDHQKLNYIYNASDIVIIPSRSESFGMVALEALASKTPFIVSNVGGMAEIIKSNKKGILVDKALPESFANLLLDFFKNKIKIDKDEENKINIHDYNWDKIFHRMLN